MQIWIKYSPDDCFNSNFLKFVKIGVVIKGKVGAGQIDYKNENLDVNSEDSEEQAKNNNEQ